MLLVIVFQTQASLRFQNLFGNQSHPRGLEAEMGRDSARQAGSSKRKSFGSKRCKKCDKNTEISTL